MAATSSSTVKLAAVCSANTTDTDLRINTLVKALMASNYKVCGVLQKPLAMNAPRCNARLSRIDTKKQYDISQQLGGGSTSCNLDTAVLEQAAFDICTSLNKKTDLVVVNRFGKRELQGGGFRSVFERALALDTPVLTIVQDQWSSAWLEYGGSSVSLLDDSFAALTDWLGSAVTRLPIASVG